MDGVNETVDDHHMWLVPFNKGENHKIIVDLGKKTKVSGIKLWNYNKSAEDTLRGSKQIVLKVDGELVSPKQGFTLRKALGWVAGIDSGHKFELPFALGYSSE